MSETPPPKPGLAARGSQLLAEIEAARASAGTRPEASAPPIPGPAESPADDPAADLADLIAAALAARASAYAPYSRYTVGAAVRADDGRVFRGANVENASYGLSVCAERSAIVTAVSAGARRVVAIAIATGSSPPAAPCGMCRQTLAEFADDALPIALCNDRGEIVHLRLGELLPRAFRGDSLLP